MADLWDALNDTETAEPPTTTIAIKTPSDIVVEGLINHDKIRSETEQLRTCLDCSAQIVITAYKVADYVPNLKDSKHREFWEQEVS